MYFNLISNLAFRQILLFFVCGLVVLLGAMEALAKTPATILPKTVVTANLVPSPERAIGTSVSIVTSEEIQRKQVNSVSDVLRELPGIAVLRTGTVGGFTQLRIRGAEGNHTLVIIDGVKVNDPSGGSEFDFGSLRAADVERIEVLRGPQSSIYGSDAIGGVVNIITKRGFGPAAFTSITEAGSLNTTNAAVSLSGGGMKYNYYAGLTGYQTQGHSIAPESEGNSEIDGNKNFTFNFKAGFKPLENLDIDVFIRRVGDITESDSQPAVSGTIFTRDEDGETDVDQRTGKLLLKYTMNDGNWQHLLSASKHSHHSDTSVKKEITFEAEGEKTRFNYQTNMFFSFLDTIDSENRVTLLIERETDKQVTRSPWGNNDHTITNYSLVGEYGLDFEGQLFITGGLRHDKNNIFQNANTFRLTSSYLLKGTGARFHGSYGKGVKNPTLYELFGSSANYEGNPLLNPEKSIGWDFGLEQALFDDSVNLDITYFNNRITNLIQGSGNTSKNLSGMTKIDGIEISLEGKVFNNLIFSGQYTYTNGKDDTGKSLIRRARHLASTNFIYTFYDDRAKIDLGVDYNGEQWDVQFSNYFASQKNILLDDFILVNVAGSYDLTDKVTLLGRVENILDTKHQEVWGFDGPGIGAFIGIRTNFGL